MHNRHCRASTKAHGRLIAALVFAALFLLPQIAHAGGIVTPQVFSRGSFVFVVETQRIVFLSMDTRSSHTLYNADDELFNIVSAVRSGDMIWASLALGSVIAVNMQTGTVEEFSRGLIGGGGHIDVSRRFVWLASGDTLHRMDLTGRDWVRLPIPNSGGEVRGIISFNDQVHIISERAVHVLTTASEDWVVIPHKNFTLTPGDVRKLGDAAYFTQERALYRYDPSKRSWNKGTVREKIRAVHLSPELLAVATENRVYNFNTTNFLLESLPTQPMLRDIRSITRLGEATICVTGRGIAISATSPFNFNINMFPGDFAVGENVFAFERDGNVIVYANGKFIFHNPERRLWSDVRITPRHGGLERRGLHGWTDEGAHMNITENIHSSLHGGVTLRQQPSAHNHDGEIEMDLGETITNATLNIHTVDSYGRTLDLSIDNAPTTLPPLKGLYYKGIEGDILNRASYGVQGTGLAESRINTDVVVEGGSAVFSSAAKAPGSDRSFLSATAGSGHILSKTEWRTYDYHPSGFYRIEGVGANREVVAASVKIYLDGIPVPGNEYVYNPANRTVRLLRREKSNPTSIIRLSFSERIQPDDPNSFEPLPENHFGQYHFAEGSVSPRSWMSARAGVMSLDRGGPAGASEPPVPMVIAGLPVELRGGANHSLLLHPEIAYDSRLGTHSAGFTAGAREGRMFGSYRGLWTEHDFFNLDRPQNDYDYQRTDNEHELSLGYDLRSNLRANWYQFHRHTNFGDLSHLELRSSYTGDGRILPSADVSISSHTMDYNRNIGAERDRKETFALRFYDPAARFLNETNHLHNVGYDFSWTEYRTNSGQNGRVLHGETNISPISRLTFTSLCMYRQNPSNFHAREEINPRLLVSTRDLPRGFDFNAHYSLHHYAFAEGDGAVNIYRDIYGFIYPGEYINALDKFAIRIGYFNETESHVYPATSPLRYIMFTDEHTFRIWTAGELGLLYFPLENLLLSTLNSTHKANDDHASYSSHERAKLWFSNGSSLEGNFNVSTHPNWLYLHANALYEHRWNSGLMTGAGLFGTRNSDNLPDNLVVNTYGGPILFVSQVKDLRHDFFKNIEHYHRLQTTLNTVDMSKPDLFYNLYLRLKMPPNISLVAEIGLNIEKLDKAAGAGGIYLHAGF